MSSVAINLNRPVVPIPVSSQATMVETKFHIGMTCEGCASAVKRILSKVEGVESVDTNVDAKSVIVQADVSVSPQVMLEKLEKVCILCCICDEGFICH